MKGKVKYDQHLTNLSLAFPTGNLIGDMIAPIVSADNYSDYVFVDADDGIMQMNDEAEATKSNGVDFAVGDPYTYRTKRRALNHVILDKELNNSKKNSIIKAEQRITNKLTHRLRLKHEMRVQEILRSTSKVVNYTNVDSVASARLDEASPTFETDIVTAVKSINDKTGAIANTIVIPYQAAIYAANISFIADTLKYQYGMEYVKGNFQGQAIRTVGLPPIIKGLNVIISNGRVGNYNKGKTAAVTNPWGKDILIGYVPPNPGVEDMFGIATMEYDPFKVSKERVTDPEGTKIITEWDYDILEANLACWYLLQNVIG